MATVDRLSGTPSDGAAADRLSGVETSVAIKAPVKVATTANITLSGEQTIDGVAVTSGDRVLAKDQSTASENGIYTVATSAWSRALDFNGDRDFAQGTEVLVLSGTTNARKRFFLSTSSPAIGSSLAFSEISFSGLGDAATGNIGVEVQGYDAGLASIAGLTTAADKMIYTTASDTYAVADLTAAGRALLDDADASAQRTTLGLGTAAVAALIDDDTMATATAANIASAESTKAYVDNTIPLTRTSASTTTGGTSIDFTSLPSGVSEVEIYLTGVSLSGTANLLIQIGDSGGVETTGYDSGAGTGSGGTTSTSGFVMIAGLGTYEVSGIVQLRHMGGNKWVMGAMYHVNGATDATTAAGFKTLSGELGRVRITTTNGTDTIDANSGIQVATR